MPVRTPYQDQALNAAKRFKELVKKGGEDLDKDNLLLEVSEMDLAVIEELLLQYPTETSESGGYIWRHGSYKGVPLQDIKPPISE